MVKQTSTLVLAHRGFRSLVPENTMPAARKAYESGADYWELDVAASSDEVLVVLHDESLARTTDARQAFPERSPWSVYDFSFSELQSLDAGSWYGAADPYGMIASGRLNSRDIASYKSLRIPTLREALEYTAGSGWKVNIEIKDATGKSCDAWIVERTARLVQDLHMEKSVIVSSFNHSYLSRMKKAEPAIDVAALIDEPLKDPVATLQALDAVALNPNLKYLDQGTVAAVRSAGLGVLVWTVNEIADMHRLVSWGVTGLITDFPDRALEVLGRRQE